MRSRIESMTADAPAARSNDRLDPIVWLVLWRETPFRAEFDSVSASRAYGPGGTSLLLQSNPTPFAAACECTGEYLPAIVGSKG